MKSKRNFSLEFLTFLFLLAVSFKTFSQSAGALRSNLNGKDSTIIKALVLYPDNIRLSIFEVCKYSDALAKTAELQKNSAKEFAAIIFKNSKSEQEGFWNLTRYPGLIDKLTGENRMAAKDIDSLLSEYPDDVQITIRIALLRNSDEVQQIKLLKTKSEQSFDAVLKPLPGVAQSAFRDVINFPEVLTILTEHMDMAGVVGEFYKNYPRWIMHAADSIKMMAVQQRAKDIARWRKMIEGNPDALNEIKKIAEEYEFENCEDREKQLLHLLPPAFVDSYTCQAFSYWFGHPWWYPSDYWYAYPFWYDLGFYYDQKEHINIIDMPSYYFTNWYFYNPAHLITYPNLCNILVDQFYTQNSVPNLDANVVRNWVNQNRIYLPKDFVATPMNRVNIIKQFGQFESDWEQMALNNGTMSREAFLQKNHDKYPTLNSFPNQNFAGANQQANRPLQEKGVPLRQPFVKVTPTPSAPGRQTRTSEKSDFTKLNQAQEYHRASWEQNQPPKPGLSGPVPPAPPINNKK